MLRPQAMAVNSHGELTLAQAVQPPALGRGLGVAITLPPLLYPLGLADRGAFDKLTHLLAKALVIRRQRVRQHSHLLPAQLNAWRHEKPNDLGDDAPRLCCPSRPAAPGSSGAPTSRGSRRT